MGRTEKKFRSMAEGTDDVALHLTLPYLTVLPTNRSINLSISQYINLSRARVNNTAKNFPQLAL
jgi:hypothetical protein